MVVISRKNHVKIMQFVSTLKAFLIFFDVNTYLV